MTYSISGSITGNLWGCSAMEYEKSCGAVVYTKINGPIKYILVQELGGAWSFPKGHMERGETEEQTALREIYEEVHLKVNFLKGFRATEEYAMSEKENVIKQVVYFCAEYHSQDIKAQDDELLRASLVSYEEALQLIEFESSKRILKEAHDFILNR